MAETHPERVVRDVTVAKKAMFAGIVLIAVGVVTWAISASGSVTALIPAGIGVVLALLGLGAQSKPDLSHHLMHAAAAVALLALLASLMSLVTRFNSEDGYLAEASQAISVVVLGWFIFSAVQSFKSARAATQSVSGNAA